MPEPSGDRDVGVSGGFERKRRVDGVTVTFEPLEAAMLRQFLGELLALLELEIDEPGEPTDPAVGALAGLEASLDDIKTLADLERLGADVEPPDDPVLRRLLPDAYPDDEAASRDFRRYTQDGLVARKYDAARTALATLVPSESEEPEAMAQAADDQLTLVLTDDEARAWLGALNDVRLALGTRLGVEQDDDEMWAALADDDPRATVHQVYSWLGWLQETLVRALW
jgi:hypothetical protein